MPSRPSSSQSSVAPRGPGGGRNLGVRASTAEGKSRGGGLRRASAGATSKSRVAAGGGGGGGGGGRGGLPPKPHSARSRISAPTSVSSSVGVGGGPSATQSAVLNGTGGTAQGNKARGAIHTKLARDVVTLKKAYNGARLANEEKAKVLATKQQEFKTKEEEHGTSDLQELLGYKEWLGEEMEDMTTATFVESETQRMLVHVALRSKHELLRAQSHLQTLEEEVLATQEVSKSMEQSHLMAQFRFSTAQQALETALTDLIALRDGHQLEIDGRQLEMAEFDKWKEVNSTIDQHRERVVAATGATGKSKKRVRKGDVQTSEERTAAEDAAAIAGPYGKAAMKIFQVTGIRKVSEMAHLFIRQRERNTELNEMCLVKDKRKSELESNFDDWEKRFKSARADGGVGTTEERHTMRHVLEQRIREATVFQERKQLSCQNLEFVMMTISATVKDICMRMGISCKKEMLPSEIAADMISGGGLGGGGSSPIPEEPVLDQINNGAGGGGGGETSVEGGVQSAASLELTVMMPDAGETATGGAAGGDGDNVVTVGGAQEAVDGEMTVLQGRIAKLVNKLGGILDLFGAAAKSHEAASEAGAGAEEGGDEDQHSRGYGNPHRQSIHRKRGPGSNRRSTGAGATPYRKGQSLPLPKGAKAPTRTSIINIQDGTVYHDANDAKQTRASFGLLDVSGRGDAANKTAQSAQPAQPAQSARNNLGSICEGADLQGPTSNPRRQTTRKRNSMMVVLNVTRSVPW